MSDLNAHPEGLAPTAASKVWIMLGLGVSLVLLVLVASSVGTSEVGPRPWPCASWA